MEMEADQTSAFISGFGAMPNCHMRLKNIAESTNEYDTVGITRSDPGIGAFTGYHNRRTTALNDIRAGQEVGCIMMWLILLTYYYASNRISPSTVICELRSSLVLEQRKLCEYSYTHFIIAID